MPSLARTTKDPVRRGVANLLSVPLNTSITLDENGVKALDQDKFPYSRRTGTSLYLTACASSGSVLKIHELCYYFALECSNHCLLLPVGHQELPGYQEELALHSSAKVMDNSCVLMTLPLLAYCPVVCQTLRHSRHLACSGNFGLNQAVPA